MASGLKRRQTIDVKIETVAYSGKGVAHYNDFVIFVERTLPGDVVNARIQKVKRNYAEAIPLTIIEPSPLREPAPCAHFGHCGGCKWQNVSYQTQLKFKKQHVEESLKHIGNVSPEVIHDVLPSPKIFGYRNKMEFSFAERGWLTPEELGNPEIKKEFALGLHVPGFFDRIINITNCMLQSDKLNDILNFTRDYLKKLDIPIYHLRKKEGILRFLVLRESFATGNVMVNLVTFSPVADSLKGYVKELIAQFPYVSAVVNTINSRPAQIATGEETITLYGTPVLYEQIGPYRFEISPESFFQTNSLQAENLYNTVKRFAAIDDDVVWDLYSGTGSIAIYIAEKAKKVIGFEVVENAVKDAYRNAQLNQIENCEFVAGDVKQQLERFAGEPPDVIICDPPRAGMHKDVLQVILNAAPRRIVYVSCNPTTMARDLGELSSRYTITEVQPVDMFPHTYHIETVAKLIRR